jgi:hypothetical protein
MTYLPTMGAADAVPSFNTTKYPGVCKPSNEPTLQLVYDLQNQLNRVAQAKGLTKIGVDGDIGPGTIKLFNAVLGTSANCVTIGATIGAFTAQVTAIANELGAPAKVSGPIPAKAPTIVTATGLEVKGPPPAGSSLVDSVKNLGMPTLLALGVGLGAAAYFMTKKKGRK